VSTVLTGYQLSTPTVCLSLIVFTVLLVTGPKDH